MDSLPVELITDEISNWLLPIDKQIMRRINIKFQNLFSFKELIFNNTKVELVHIIKYKKYWNNNTTVNASKNGNIGCLKYLHENDCLWDERTTFFAAVNGHLDCAFSVCS